MNKRYFIENLKKKFHINRAVPVIVMIVVLGLSIGYSSFSSTLSITGIVSTIEAQKDVRISNVSVQNETNNDSGTVSNLTYDNTSISANIALPNDSSSIIFDVEIKNLGNVESGILEITGLPENLDYEFLDYEEKSKLCNEELKCSLGMIKNIQLRIKYKEDGWLENNPGYNVNLVFNFQPVYNVVYTGITNNDYPSEAIATDTFEVDLGENAPENVLVFIEEIQISNYTYENGLLSIPNVSGNIEIKDGLRNSTFSDNFIVLNDVKSTNIKGLTISGNSIQNGTPTPTNPVEIESVGDYDSTIGKYVIPITISGKNLLNENLYRTNQTTKAITIDYEGNGIFHIYGEHTAGSSNTYFYLQNVNVNAPINANEYYTYSATLIEGTTSHNIVPYLGAKSDTTSNKNWIATTIQPTTSIGKTVTKTSKPSTSLADANSIGNIWFYINVPATQTFTVDCRIQVWLEKGSEATHYEPYVEPITHNIYLDEPLRKINSSYDYIDFNAGVVVRNIAEVKLTGKENWAEYKSTDTYKRFITKALDGKAKQNQYANVYSNRFKGTSTIGTVNGIRIASGSSMTEFYLDPLEFQDLASFKSWMSTNNIIVDYILNTSADPESIELPNINLIKGYNEITIGTTIAPTVTISYY